MLVCKPPVLGKNSQVVSEYPSKSPATAWITAYCFMVIELKFDVRQYVRGSSLVNYTYTPSDSFNTEESVLLDSKSRVFMSCSMMVIVAEGGVEPPHTLMFVAISPW